MKRVKNKILSLVIVLCLLLSVNSAYANELDNDTIVIGDETYTVVVYENDFTRSVALYDEENNLIEMYSLQKEEQKIVNLITNEVVGYGILQNPNSRAGAIDDEGYYHGGKYLYGFDNISSQAGFVASLISVGVPLGLASEIASSAGIAGLFISAQAVIDYYFDIMIDEWWKTDSLYQYCKRVVNVYLGAYADNNHVGGPWEWLRKTSIHA